MRDYDGFFADAVQYFWSLRKKDSVAEPAEYTGRRSEVVGGRHCDGFLLAIHDLLVEAGVPEASIFTQRSKLSVPSFFRPTKMWDLLVVQDGVLLAAIEVKAQVGPSFSSNANNRAEEAIGNAVDVWTTYREGGFQDGPEPFLGYIAVVEDCTASRKMQANSSAHFEVFPVFETTSYVLRWEELCRRLVSERLYSAAVAILADPDDAAARPNYTEPAADVGVARFCDQLLRRVVPL